MNTVDRQSLIILHGDSNHPQREWGINNFQPEAMRPTCLLIRSHQDALALKHLSKLTILMHGHQNIAAANKLLVEVQLRNSRPIRVLLDT